jgi:D-alanyl-D-alanine carboxypeptidase (penicillin-binding protein 5/6)
MNIALVFAIILQFTGIWGLIGNGAQNSLTAAALKHPLINSTGSNAAPAPLSYGSIPAQTGQTELDLGSTTSAFALDATTAMPLYAQNAGQQRPIASVTKLITALTVLSSHDPSERVTIPALPTYPDDADLLGLRPGETYSLGDLVQAALIISGNDAADSLAIFDAGSISAFASRMNSKLAEWGIIGANFSNPSGLIDSGNSASAESLSRIALLALKNPFIRDAVAKQSITITSSAGRQISGVTTDKLLAAGNFYGIKTGYTGAAGQCFVGLTKINGHDVITVILGSDDRFGDTTKLASWIKENYTWF